jgi:hypothetical protein
MKALIIGMVVFGLILIGLGCVSLFTVSPAYNGMIEARWAAIEHGQEMMLAYLRGNSAETETQRAISDSCVVAADRYLARLKAIRKTPLIGWLLVESWQVL